MNRVEYLSSRLPHGKVSQNGWFNTTCINPAHADSNPSFGIQLATGRGYCLSCRFAPGWSDIVGLLEGTGTDGYLLAIRITDPGVEASGGLRAHTAAARRRVQHHEFWVNRGLRLSTVLRYELGFDPARREVHAPIFYPDGTRAGHVTRPIDRKRYINNGFAAGDILVGYHLLERPAPLIYCAAGLVDTYCIAQELGPAVGRLGDALSRRQRMLLERTGAVVVMMVDLDHLAMRNADQWAKDGYHIGMVEAPFKDPGDMLKDTGRLVINTYPPLAWQMHRQLMRTQCQSATSSPPP